MPRSDASETDDWARPVSHRDRLVDVVIAVLLLACSAVTIPLSAADAPDAPVWFTAGWALLITIPLVWRRRFPSTVAVVVTAVFVIGQVTVTPEPLVSQISPFIALYTVGAWGADRRRSRIVRGTLVGAILAWLVIVVVNAPALLPRQAGTPSGSALGLAALSSALYLAAAMAFGEVAWRSARRQAMLETRTRELQAEREHSARQAVVVERMRIARDLHDVVAHHVSLIGIQAGAARRVFDTAPEKVPAALQAIEKNAREAVEELHDTLGALRSGDSSDSPADAPSTLGVEQLPALVDEAQHAGTPTALSVTGDRRPLHPAVALTLYRVAQEALTNVRKHAGSAATAQVRLRYAAASVELEVEDWGGSASEHGSSAGGMGLLGMRERVAAVRGELDLVRRDHGYLVRATIPLSP